MSERPILKLKLPKAAPLPDPTVPASAKKLTLKIGGAKKEPKPAGGKPDKASKANKEAKAEKGAKAGKGGKKGKGSQAQDVVAAAAANGEDALRPSPKLVFKSKKKPGPVAGKKRGREDEAALQTPASAGPKRIKLTSKGHKSNGSTAKTPTTPFIRLKAKGRPPVKPMGIGYDSEASDAEEDPHIEEEFVLRMQPGEDCEYVRAAIAGRTLGMPLRDGGADVKLKFLRHDGRRAVLAVRGNMYAASMVDLPCVVEGMKSWDKKGWWKTADISQMLLVLGRVRTEQEAESFALPEQDMEKGTFNYQHGITPPMRWVKKRRFRKRVSTSIVMQVEQQVEDLFRRDAEAIFSDYKVQTLDEHEDEKRTGPEESYFDDMQQDGDEDDDEAIEYEGEFEQDAEMEDADGEGIDMDEWEQMMEEDHGTGEGEGEGGGETGGTVTGEQTSQADTPVQAEATQTDSEAATPGGGGGGIGMTAVIDAEDEAETPAADAPEDDESGSDADEDDVDEEADEEELEYQRKRDEVAELEQLIRQKEAQMATINNSILRKRQATALASLKEDLNLKKKAIGEDADDD